MNVRAVSFPGWALPWYQWTFYYVDEENGASYISTCMDIFGLTFFMSLPFSFLPQLIIWICGKIGSVQKCKSWFEKIWQVQNGPHHTVRATMMSVLFDIPYKLIHFQIILASENGLLALFIITAAATISFSFQMCMQGTPDNAEATLANAIRKQSILTFYSRWIQRSAQGWFSKWPLKSFITVI